MEFVFVLLLWLQLCAGVIHRGPTRELNLNEDQVWKWSDTLSRRLTSFSENVTAIDFISAEYARSSHLKEENGDDIIEDLASKIEKLLKDRLTALDNLVVAAEKLYEDYSFDPNLDIDYLNSKKLLSESDLPMVSQTVVNMEMTFRSLRLKPDPALNNISVTKNTSTIQVPTNVFDRSPKIMNGAYWTKPLDDTFINNLNNYSLTWQYYCSTDGFFRIYPGMKWPNDNVGNNIDLFDCRVRSWYLQAATCPKNVIILIDTSGSMKGLRMEIARSTVKQIIDTLDDDDYFNIIKFSDSFSYLDECFNGTMMSANSINKRHMAGLVDETDEAKNKANFEIAFDEAFRLLKAERLRRNKILQQDHLCNKAILLITDGVPEHHAPLFDKYNWPEKRLQLTNRKKSKLLPFCKRLRRNKILQQDHLCNKTILLITDGVPEHHAPSFDKYNWPEKQTRIFTYLIGREIGDEREVKWMACANKGYYTHISTLADVQENVQNYIRVLSRPMVINRYHNKIWTPVYLDHMSSLNMKKGLQFMTSVAIPVFDKKNDTTTQGNLLGVVGTDVPIKFLQKQLPPNKLGANGYAFMINHNGYVLFHPDYRPYFRDPETDEVFINPHYQNVDLSDVLLPTNQAAFDEVREHILSGHYIGSKMLEVLTHYDDMRRMVWRNYSFSYKKLMETNFSLGIALPTTSFVKVNMVPVKIDMDESLNESSILLAPWKYCKSLGDNLTGRERVVEFKKILKNETLQKLCDIDLTNMVWTESYLMKEWAQRDFKTNARDGVDIVFVGTPSGVTKYVLLNPDSDALYYLLNRTSTIEADYYERAIEGAELLDNQPHWNYTFSVPINGEYDENRTVVTVSAPIAYTEQKKMGVAAVVGYQIKHMSFTNIFMESVEGCRMYMKKCNKKPCKEKPVNCYLIDNHGYVVSGPFPGMTGVFFGDVDGPVMTDIVLNKQIFKGYNFTDYQSMCEIKGDSVKENSSGTSILNPLKLVFNILMWLTAEIAIFLSELSLTSLWTHTAAQSASELCNNISDYEDQDLTPRELISLRQASSMCAWENRENKVLGYRPCIRQYTLYHSDLKVFHKRKPIIHGTVDGCVTCSEYSQCSLEEEEEGCMPECVRESACLKSYIVTWVQGTNLLMVVTAANCECNTTMPFNMEHTELQYTEDELCYIRQQETYKDRNFFCIDHSDQGRNDCGEMKKLLVTSNIFSFHNVFKNQYGLKKPARIEISSV